MIFRSGDYRQWMGLCGILLLCLGFLMCAKAFFQGPARAVSLEAPDSRVNTAVEELFDRISESRSVSNEAQIADQLETLGPKAIWAIEPQLQSENQWQRVVALLVLNRLNEKRKPAEFSEAAVKRYLSLLSDDSVMVRTYAMESLIRSGRRFRGIVMKHRAASAPEIQRKLDIVLREMR